MSILQCYLAALAVVLGYFVIVSTYALASKKPEEKSSLACLPRSLSQIRWTSLPEWIDAVHTQQTGMASGGDHWSELLGGVIALGDTGFEISPNSDPENIDSRFVLSTPEGSDFFACEDLGELKRVAEALADQRRQADELFLDTDIGT
jgi:hypothetical protein